MFGESESESPRVNSPWDHVLASNPAKEKVYYSRDSAQMLSLSAEVEEGNIEYKLHLIQPSPARFARLVTQLKWRLLEGGGQAFYELGVADSGTLVGLTPDDLADTLTTLRAMAAEIDARVVITKEIEVVGMGVREEDEREFAKKRRGRDRAREKAASKAKAQTKAKWRGTPGSYASVTSTASSFEPSSMDSVPLDEDDAVDDLVPPTPSLDASLSASPSPLPIPTPSNDSQISVCTELDESLVLFTMDDDVPLLAQSIHEELIEIEAKAPASAAEFRASTTAITVVPAAVSIQPSSFRPLTKAERRRITRDLRRDERKKALGQEAVEDDVLSRARAPSAAIEDLDKPATLEYLKNELASLNISAVASAAPRMIVEAMVLRDLEVEEAFLDFARV